MTLTITREMDALERGMNFLASIGSVSPFVGLFGTVWGIMNSFQSIAGSKIPVLPWWHPVLPKPCLPLHWGCWRPSLRWRPITNFPVSLDKVSSALEIFAQEFTTLLGRQLDEGGK